MAVAARINHVWALKWLGVSTAMMIFGGLCIYDALAAYPEHNRRVALFKEHADRGEAGKRGWLKLAEANGWSPDDPGAERSEQDIDTQWYQLAIVWPLGLAGYGWLIFNARRRLVAEEEHLLAPDGQKVPYSAIHDIDKTRWDRKGIAIVHYKADDGREGTVKIDDWIYRDADQVLEEVEAHTGLVGDELPGDA